MLGGVQPVKAVLYVNGKPMAELEEIENIELDERSMQDDYSEKQMINKDETFSFTIENAEFNEKTFWENNQDWAKSSLDKALSKDD